jgi:FlaA1/EpsC-like NDP-sugar epimerase
MFFKDKKILIIGGTGTIGQGLLFRILEDMPQVVRIFSRDEYKQFILQKQLGNREELRFLIGDIRDYDRLRRAMEDIDYVFHTAAMKHVPACEYNPYEAVLTNIMGTQHVIKAAIAENVNKVVFTSSDKAVSPTNVYGATKLTAERLIRSAEYSKGKSKTIFSTVRLGNVIGSRGSVIPLFVQQILNNRKITVTNLSMSRFMMTLAQATNLTIEAMKESRGGEIFVLKMPAIFLEDLVKVILNETCRKYDITRNEVAVEEIGLRPGEKMFEELMTFDESMNALEHSRMFIIPPDFKKNIYPGAEKVIPRSYSSSNEKPISQEEITLMIKSEVSNESV